MGLQNSILNRNSIIHKKVEHRNFQRTTGWFVAVVFVIHLNPSFSIEYYAIMD